MSVSEYNRISSIDSSVYAQVPTEQRVMPTEDDYSRGWYYRYFMAKVNGVDSVREVTKKTFDAFASNSFWIGISLKWNIVASDASIRNKEQIRFGLRTIRGLDGLLPNLVEFHASGGYESTGDLEPSAGEISEQRLFD